MENVAAFNNELSGLYDTKPPISKAKMAAITKAAMKAIKFYKHVVQSVEKFILKCKPEYKVPGLYVIDSIVRQSRHQFGPDKDVFAPRFARNMKDTFANLFRCAPEDKSRIIRVLNLWQKNSVFAPEVIQPIFDLADPNHPIYQMPIGGIQSGPSGSGSMTDMAASTSNGLNASVGSMDISMNSLSGGGHGTVDDKMAGLPDLSPANHENVQSVRDSSASRQMEHMSQSYHKRQSVSSCPGRSRDTSHHSATYGCLIDAQCGSGNCGCSGSSKTYHSDSYTKFPSCSHDVDYNDDLRDADDDDDDDDDDYDNRSPQHSSTNLLDNNNLKQLLNDPNVLRQLQTLRNFQKFRDQDDKQSKSMQDDAFEKHLQNVLKASGSAGAQDPIEFNKEVEFVSEEKKIEVINLDGNDSRSPSAERDRDRDRYKRRRSRTRSRSRSRSRDRSVRDRDRDRDRDRRRRSRSRSRSRSPRSNRRRSSRDREQRSTRDKEKDREHERERRRKGLPDIKREHLSVCSTTLWVGHLSKLVYQEELSDTFGEYGDIVSIDQIVPRGCAFIVMNRRQDAHKAMQSLKNHKLQGRSITISWAAGKGVKSKEWKDYWDLELGVTFIPWNKLEKDTDFDALEEGGMFDEDSMPGWMKEKINHMKSLKEQAIEQRQQPHQGIPGSVGGSGMLFGIDTTQPPPGPPPPGGPPPMMSMVPGQFSMGPPMGAPPRMLGPPMGMSLSGIPMPPSLVAGIPPHPHPSHAMMMPPSGMLPPAFPPMPGSVGGAGPMNPALTLPPGAGQFVPQPTANPGGTAATSSAMGVSGSNISSNDDHMDIEMDEDEPSTPTQLAPSTATAPPMNFNQPPPLFAVGNNAIANSDGSGESFSRDRNRGAAGSSRWSGRNSSGGDEDGDGGARWRENAGANGLANFMDGRGRNGGPMNIPPLDLNNPPQRPDFMNDFENRGGPCGPRGGNHNGDFFPNMHQQQQPNRFNPPTSLLQMRIPPPNSFNPRMGGAGTAPLFMRGQGGPGNRPQGPGFFNPRNPFDRDVGVRGGGGRGGGRGGGVRGGVGRGPGNWSDEEGDESGNNFKRREPGGNRFRDREDDRRDRGGRRGAGGDRTGPWERFGEGERDRDRDGGRDRSGRNGAGNTRSGSQDENTKPKTGEAVEKSQTSSVSDIEDDWDRELDEFNGAKAKGSNKTPDSKPVTLELESNVPATNTDNGDDFESKCENDGDVEPKSSDQSKPTNPFANNSGTTPLYDETPAAGSFAVESKPATEPFDALPQKAEPEPDAHASTGDPAPTPTPTPTPLPPPPPPVTQLPSLEIDKPSEINTDVVEDSASQEIDT